MVSFCAPRCAKKDVFSFVRQMRKFFLGPFTAHKQKKRKKKGLFITTFSRKTPKSENFFCLYGARTLTEVRKSWCARCANKNKKNKKFALNGAELFLRADAQFLCAIKGKFFFFKKI